MEELLSPYPIQVKSHKALDGYISHNYRLEDHQGKFYLLKHHKSPKEHDLIEAENELMKLLDATMPFDVSRPAFSIMPMHRLSPMIT